VTGADGESVPLGLPGDAGHPRPASTASGSAMADEARRRFLERPLIARLATSKDDHPRVLPMWFWWDGAVVWMETGASFANTAILRANPHAALTIDESDGGLALRAIVMRGTVEVIDHPPDRVMATVRRIYERYVGPDGLRDPAVLAMLVGEHVLLRFVPTFEISWDTTTEL
jgi:nitroimidazol reductase NimA-like FMN-containing flavoprotein (pyridoxamine 5'-phosphate oxidase superfamily)